MLLQTLLLILGVAAVAGYARRYGLSAPILLVLAGLAASSVPGVPSYHLDPELILTFFLPPLVYSAAIGSSLSAVRANARPIGLLSVGLVVFTAVVVAVVARLVVPGLPWSAAMALGAILGPTDAVAATAIARRVGLPPRIVTVLEGESLLNDATALVMLRVAVLATVTGSVSVLDIGWRLLLAVLGGTLVGLAVARLIAMVRRRTNDPLIENTLSLLTPFLAYLPAESIQASGVLAVVITGLRLSHDAPVLMSPAARLAEHALWRMIDFLLEGIVFALIGLQLPDILDSLDGYSAGSLAGAAVAVTVAVVLSRFVWTFPATYLPRLLSRRLRDRDPYIRCGRSLRLSPGRACVAWYPWRRPSGCRWSPSPARRSRSDRC